MTSEQFNERYEACQQYLAYPIDVEWQKLASLAAKDTGTFIVLGRQKYEGDTLIGVRYNRYVAIELAKSSGHLGYDAIRVERWTEAGSDKEPVAEFC